MVKRPNSKAMRSSEYIGLSKEGFPRTCRILIETRDETCAKRVVRV